MSVGRKKWVVPGGHIPLRSTGREPELTSHDAISVLNAGRRDVTVRITIYHTDREPVGPYQVAVQAGRVRRVRINDLIDPQAVPLDVSYSLVVDADGPVVVQMTRLDTSGAARASMGTIAFPAQ